jgi:TRAP-type C4-dicarboxylate transport system substrate-binding protein
MEAVTEANQQAREHNESQVEERIAYLEEQGMEVIRPSEEDLTAFRDIGQPAYLEWLKERNIDQRWIDMALEDAGMSDLLD